MIGIVWIILGIAMIISAISTKNNPTKVLDSKARKKKANLSDEEYVAHVYKSSILLGVFVIILGVLRNIV